MMTLIQLVHTDHPTLDAACTLAEAAHRMRETDLDLLPVTDATGRPLGLVTARDLLDAGLLAGGLPGAGGGAVLEVRAVLRAPAPMVSADAPLEEVCQRMLAQRLPAVLVADTGGRLLGVAGLWDVLRALSGTQASASPEPDSVRRVRGDSG